MAISDSSTTIVSKHWLRMPAASQQVLQPPGAGSARGTELFIFTGIAIFDKLKGAGSDWDEGEVKIFADYSNVIDADKAILPQHWTVDIHLASIFNKNVAKNTGWSVNRFGLERVDNNLGGPKVAATSGILRLKAAIAIRDIDAMIHRLSYHVTILGKVVDWESTIIID